MKKTMLQMKRSIIVLLVLIIAIIGAFCIPISSFAEDESTDDYIEISTPKDLYKIRSNMEGKYKLVNDIDLTEATAPGGVYDYNGCGWNPIGSNNKYSDIPFTGVFDGQGYTIKGMRININTSFGGDYTVGLFSNNSGTIKNIKMKDVSISVNTTKGIHNIYAASVAGLNSGIIENVQVLSGNIFAKNVCGEKSNKGNDNFYVYVSGISNGKDGILYDCYNDASVTGYGIGSFYSWFDNYNYKTYYYYTYANVTVTGIRGNEISRCVNKGQVKSEYSGDRITVCGIIGSTINDSYNTSSITGSGISGSVIQNSYYLKSDNSNIVGYYKGNKSSSWIGLNDAQMRDSDFFEGFDFENVWRMSDETVYKYPQLRSIRNGITKVEIISEPTNEIVVGTTLKYEGAVARIYREDGSTEDVELTPDNTTGGDTSTTGKKTVTYTYKGASASFEIDVKPVKIIELEITSLPKKVDYIEGQEFDPTGLKVYAIKNNGTRAVCNDYAIDDVDTTPGKKTVTVSYNSVTTSFEVNYVKKQITKLEIASKPTKLIYNEGEPFDNTGMVVKAVYNDVLEETVTNYTVDDISGFGKVNVEISFEGLTASVQITVSKLIKSIKIQDEQQSIIESQEKDIAVEMVPADADDDSLVWKSSNYSVVTVDNNGHIKAIKEGNAVITVSVSDNPSVTAQCSINVIKKRIESIEITNAPYKMNYLEGEKFDSSGMVVQAVYNTGEKYVTTSYSVGSIEGTGNVKVRIEYSGLYNFVTINVKPLTNFSWLNEVEVNEIRRLKKVTENGPIKGTTKYGSNYEVNIQGNDISFKIYELTDYCVYGKYSIVDSKNIDFKMTEYWSSGGYSEFNAKCDVTKYYNDCNLAYSYYGGSGYMDMFLTSSQKTSIINKASNITNLAMLDLDDILYANGINISKIGFRSYSSRNYKNSNNQQPTTTQPTTNQSNNQPTTSQPTTQPQNNTPSGPVISYKKVSGVGKISSDGKTLIDESGVKYQLSGKIAKNQLKKNLKVADKKTGGKYKILKVTKKKGVVTGGTVEYTAPYNKNTKLVSATGKVKIAGATFTVTRIGNSAFKNCKKLKKVVIGSGVTVIGKNAFVNTPQLQEILIKSRKIKKVGPNAFKDLNGVIKVPKDKLIYYRKKFSNKGVNAILLRDFMKPY